VNSPFWHVRNDFKTITPADLVRQVWEDDELNRKRSLTTFADEVRLVDDGLGIYVEPIQLALSHPETWNDEVRRRASLAMLIHAFNTFLARRHLLSHGYLTEARLFSRNTYESLSQAMAFAKDEGLANNFYAGRQTPPRAIHRALSSILSNEETDGHDVFRRFTDTYQQLSLGAHPTLNSFSLRTAAQKLGRASLQQSVPEDVVFGGLLQDDIGMISWLGVARSVAHAMATERFIFGDISGDWDPRARAYRASVDKRISENESELNEQLS
jgi:hypothetical protein